MDVMVTREKLKNRFQPLSFNGPLWKDYLPHLPYLLIVLGGAGEISDACNACNLLGHLKGWDFPTFCYNNSLDASKYGIDYTPDQLQPKKQRRQKWMVK